MKNLILLLLFISCGKHTTPSAFDLNDDDGDLILNQDEEGMSKFISDFNSDERNIKLNGVMRFEAQKIIEIEFKNEFDISKNALKIITNKTENPDTGRFFEEWTKINLANNNENVVLNKPYFNIQLVFNSTNVNIGSLLFIADQNVINLGPWTREMKINLSQENMNLLLKGKGHLVINPPFKTSPLFPSSSDQSIKNKTNRVYLSDGKKDQIFYVSKKLSLGDIEKLFNVPSSERVVPKELFFETNDFIENKWFSREFPNGDKVIMFTTRENLRGEFLNQFTAKKMTLSRSNGVSDNKLNLNNKMNAEVFVIIRSIMTNYRNFSETHQKVRYREGGGGGRDGNASEVRNCVHYLRSISNEYLVSNDLFFLFENFLMSSNQKTAQKVSMNDFEIRENIDEKGKFWELKSNSLAENMDLFLVNRDSSTYQITGEYARSCSDISPIAGSSNTNTEGYLRLEIESYVEKIE